MPYKYAGREIYKNIKKFGFYGPVDYYGIIITLACFHAECVYSKILKQFIEEINILDKLIQCN